MEILHSEEQLKEQVQPLFEKHGVDEIHATPDGQFFKEKHHAANHAGKNGTVYTFKSATEKPEQSEFSEKSELEKSEQSEKSEQTGEKAPAPMSVKELTSAIANIEDKAVLEQMLAAEQAMPTPRATAIKAIQDRISKLSA